MKCNKCKKKEIDREEVTEVKCKVCKKKFRSRFINICGVCQSSKKYCLVCGVGL